MFYHYPANPDVGLDDIISLQFLELKSGLMNHMTGLLLGESDQWMPDLCDFDF